VDGFFDKEALYCRSVANRAAVTPPRGTSQVASANRSRAGLVQRCSWSRAKSVILPTKNLRDASPEEPFSGCTNSVPDLFVSFVPSGVLSAWRSAGPESFDPESFGPESFGPESFPESWEQPSGTRQRVMATIRSPARNRSFVRNLQVPSATGVYKLPSGQRTTRLAPPAKSKPNCGNRSWALFPER